MATPILVTTSAIAIAPYTHKTLPYDTTRDLRAVMPLGNLTNVMIDAVRALQVAARPRRRGEGQAERADLRLDRSRQHRTSERRATWV